MIVYFGTDDNKYLKLDLEAEKVQGTDVSEMILNINYLFSWGCAGLTPLKGQTTSALLFEKIGLD